MRSASTATCRMISGEAALPATGRCTPTLIAVISRPCRRSCFADLISRNNSRPGGAGPDPSGGVTDVLGGAAGNRPGRVAREGVAAPCRAVADQPSGQRYAVSRLRIQRLTLPNECVLVGGAASRYATARSLAGWRKSASSSIPSTNRVPGRAHDAFASTATSRTLGGKTPRLARSWANAVVPCLS
jgi:hypothetical protein